MDIQFGTLVYISKEEIDEWVFQTILEYVRQHCDVGKWTCAKDVDYILDGDNMADLVINIYDQDAYELPDNERIKMFRSSHFRVLKGYREDEVMRIATRKFIAIYIKFACNPMKRIIEELGLR